MASREARGLATRAQSHPPECYGAVCVHLLRALICNFKIQSQIRSLLFKHFFQYCFPHLPLISETLLLSNFSCTLSSIFITRFSFLLLCFSMTEEILSLAGRIAHSENCRWWGVSYRKIHSSVSHPQSPSYPGEVENKKKKKRARNTVYTTAPSSLGTSG